MCKTSLVVGLAVCLIAGTALAGGTPETGVGTKQMVFMFHGLDHLGLRSYDGGLGFRYFFGEGMAIRPGVNLAYSKEDLGDDVDAPTTTDIALSVVLEKYMPAISSVSPYIGFGAGYSRSKSENVPEQPSVVTESSIEAKAVAGFQWYFTDALSLGGEYTGSFQHCKETGEDTEGETLYEWTANTFSWDASHIYFSVRF